MCSPAQSPVDVLHGAAQPQLQWLSRTDHSNTFATANPFFTCLALDPAAEDLAMRVKMLNIQVTNTSRIVLYFVSFLDLSKHPYQYALVATLRDSRFHPNGWVVVTQSHTAGNKTACQEISTGVFS